MIRVALSLFAVLTLAASGAAAPQAHIVFFTLAEDTAANREKLIEACHEHLADHEGVVYFSVGEIAEDLDREVNDLEFDVALHMIFDGRASHDVYQDHPRHKKFIEVALPMISKVRVFDSDLTPAKR